jgi:ketosteroid isomerase-like protein
VTITTIEDAEVAWLDSLTTLTRDAWAALLHPDFVAVHGPVGFIHDRATFLADATTRGPAAKVEMINTRVRHFGDTAVVTCLQEMHVAFVPGEHPFAIQAAVTRVWVREEGSWRLAHLQMARRLPPG